MPYQQLTRPYRMAVDIARGAAYASLGYGGTMGFIFPPTSIANQLGEILTRYAAIAMAVGGILSLMTVIAQKRRLEAATVPIAYAGVALYAWTVIQIVFQDEMWTRQLQMGVLCALTFMLIYHWIYLDGVAKYNRRLHELKRRTE